MMTIEIRRAPRPLRRLRKESISAGVATPDINNGASTGTGTGGGSSDGGGSPATFPKRKWGPFPQNEVIVRDIGKLLVQKIEHYCRHIDQELAESDNSVADRSRNTEILNLAYAVMLPDVERVVKWLRRNMAPGGIATKDKESASGTPLVCLALENIFFDGTEMFQTLLFHGDFGVIGSDPSLLPRLLGDSAANGVARYWINLALASTPLQASSASPASRSDLTFALVGQARAKKKVQEILSSSSSSGTTLHFLGLQGQGRKTLAKKIAEKLDYLFWCESRGKNQPSVEGTSAVFLFDKNTDADTDSERKKTVSGRLPQLGDIFIYYLDHPAEVLAELQRPELLDYIKYPETLGQSRLLFANCVPLSPPPSNLVVPFVPYSFEETRVLVELRLRQLQSTSRSPIRSEVRMELGITGQSVHLLLSFSFSPFPFFFHFLSHLWDLTFGGKGGREGRDDLLIFSFSFSFSFSFFFFFFFFF